MTRTLHESVVHASWFSLLGSCSGFVFGVRSASAALPTGNDERQHRTGTRTEKEEPSSVNDAFLNQPFTLLRARCSVRVHGPFAVHWSEVSPTVFMNEAVEGTRSRRHAFGASRSDHEQRRAGPRHGVGMGAPTPLPPTIRRSSVCPAWAPTRVPRAKVHENRSWLRFSTLRSRVSERTCLLDPARR